MKSRRISRSRLRFLLAGLLVLVLALSGGTSVSEAKKKNKPTLSINVPASVKSGSGFTVKLSGYSATYDRAGVVARSGAGCAKTASDQSAIDRHMHFYALKEHKRYTVKSTGWTAKNPGQHVVCAFLFSSSSESGKQLRKKKKYTVTL